MKYVLIKYKNIKLLVEEDNLAYPLVNHLDEIQILEKKMNRFFANLMTSRQDEIKEIREETERLISKIGYKIIGLPFTCHDAELYAIDKKLEYDEIDLEEYDFK